MAEAFTEFEPIINQPTSGACTGSIIFLHGTGGTGVSLRDGIRDRIKCDFTFPHIKVIFPTAPLIPYTLRNGELGNVWFDRAELNPNGIEYLDSINSMAERLGAMIQAEVDAGIPKHRIIIGGFSMGASMALHLALRFQQDVGAVFSLSTFIYHTSELYRFLTDTPADRYPPVLYCHGDADDFVDLEWGMEAYNRISELGVRGEFKTIPGLRHKMNLEELEIVKDWCLKQIPPL